MWRSIASNAMTFLIVALFVLGGVILWGRGQYQGPGPLADAICVQVERGTNFRRVSRNLEDEGAVTNAAIFRMGADYSDRTGALKAGSYLIEPGASMEEIVDIVTRGGASTCGTEVVYRIGVNQLSAQVRELDPSTNRFVEVAEFQPGVEETPELYNKVKEAQDTRFRIALAEGVTSWQVVTALRGMDVLRGAVEEIPPEGALAPDSYEVRVGDERADVLAKMIEQQELLVSAAWEARDPRSAAGQSRRIADPCLDHRERDGCGRRARAGRVGLCEPVEPGHAPADRPDGDLWHHQGAGRAGSGIAPIGTARGDALEYLCDRGIAADADCQSGTVEPDGRRATR